MAYIYAHKRLSDHQIFYIGISDIDNNNFARAYDLVNRSKEWIEYTKLHSYYVVIPEESKNIDWNEAQACERYLIDYFGRLDLGKGTLLNKTGGGVGGLERIFSEETRKKLSLASKGRTHSEETRKKISDGNRGKKRTAESKQRMRDSHLGHKPSEETKQKISDLAKGRKRSDKCKENISKGQKGKIVSAETKLKMSIARKNYLKNNKDKPKESKIVSEDTKNKMRESRLSFLKNKNSN
jgi:hypothetical protein